MQRILLALFVTFVAISPVLSQQTSTTTAPQVVLPAEDQNAVQSLVSGFAEAWNRHDMQAMHDLDTEDVEWVNVVGQHWVGKDTVRRGHTAIHKGMEAKTVMSVESTRLHPITPDVAIEVATLHFKGPAAPPPAGAKDTKTRGSFTAVKRNGVWKIVQFQNTIVDPVAEQFDLPSYADTGFTPPTKP